MSRTRCLLALVAVTAALLAVPGLARAAIVTNGTFETGDLSGWQHSDLPDSSAGTWFAYSGTTTPFFPDTVSAPPQGTFAAVSNQGGPGLRILYQDVALPQGFNQLQLSSWVYYTCHTLIVSPDSLDYTGPPNEQYRFDVMKPSAPIDSVASGDVLATLFRTVAGDPTSLAPVMKTLDLTSFAGQTVRLRLAEVDNQEVFNASADAIAVNGLTIGKAKRNQNAGTAKLPVTVTDPGTVSLTGKGVKTRSAPASKAVAVQGGMVKLAVKPKGKTKSTLNNTGKAKVKLTITYTPTGESPLVRKVKLKLKKG